MLWRVGFGLCGLAAVWSGLLLYLFVLVWQGTAELQRLSAWQRSAPPPRCDPTIVVPLDPLDAPFPVGACNLTGAVVARLGTVRRRLEALEAQSARP